MFKTVLRMVLIAPLLTIGASALAAEPVESGTLTLEYRVLGLGVGISKGEGVLTLKNGAQYSFTIESASIGTFGVGKVVAAGRVYNLTSPESFSGGYVATGAGFAIVAGAGISHLKNQRNKVIVVLQGAVKGFAIGLGASGTTIKLRKMIRGPDPVPAKAEITRREPKFYVLYFAFNSGTLGAEAKKSLAAITDEWKGRSAKVTLVGHTDTVGSRSYNQGLSEQRALSVQKALIENGVPAFRLDSRGFGETKLAIQTSDNVRKESNRRVEIRIE